MMSKGDVLSNCQTYLPSKNAPHVYYVGGRRYLSATEALQKYIHLWEKEHCPIAEKKTESKDSELVSLVRSLLRLLCANRIRRYIIVAKIIYKSRKKLEKLLQGKRLIN